MLKQYFKQAFYQLRENKLISIVSIVGTALAICMIMVIVLVLEVRITDCAPEVNRSRSLYMKSMSVRPKGDMSGNSSNSTMSVTTAKECFKALTLPEAVAVTSIPSKVRISIPAGKNIGADKMETDDEFWKVFAFGFIAGKPYTKADCESGLPKTVISASTARKLFGTTDVAGRTVLLNHAEYTITGVVNDVSKLATASYAQVWIPYNSTELSQLTWYENAMGAFRVIILAHSRNDFAAIREEVEKLRLKYNAGLRDSEIFYRGQPDDQFAYIYRHWSQETSGAKEAYLKYAMVIVILLLVPAINLSSMTLSRMRKRMSEIGVRKAFGATANELLRQVFFENLLLTLLAGIVGLAFSYASTFLLGNFLFSNSENMEQLGEANLAADMLLSPVVFLAALAFCFVLNTLSACIPAWRVSRLNITDALNQR